MSVFITMIDIDSMNQIVAKTIIDQIRQGFKKSVNINGKVIKFDVMKVLGAEKFTYDRNMVMFKVRNNKKVIIKVNVMDLYDVEVWDIKNILEPKQLEVIKDVYNVELTDRLLEALKVDI